jgi:hypothetical protein
VVAFYRARGLTNVKGDQGGSGLCSVFHAGRPTQTREKKRERGRRSDKRVPLSARKKGEKARLRA